MTMLLVLLLLTGWKEFPMFEPALHNIFGFTLVAVVITHILLNGRWLYGAIKNLPGRKLNSKAKYMLMLVTGLVITYFICLYSGINMYLKPPTDFIYLLHGISAIACVILTVLHVHVHWGYLKSFFKKSIVERGM
jgi:cytochrome b subunit of formate dehydrogenase